ncbi:MAG: hypothetical protein ABR961_11020 [Thermoanaerobaculaceae bacterium]
MDFLTTLRDVGACFDALGCRWAVIGALAAGIHGVPRTTVDIDALIDGAIASRLDLLLADLGYTVTFRWEESSHFSSPRPDRCPLDFLHARRPHTLAMLDRAKRVELGGTGLLTPVVEVEDLIGLKVQALVNDPDRRRGELVDIRALFEAAAARGVRLDCKRVWEYFALFGEEREYDELLKGLKDAVS